MGFSRQEYWSGVPLPSPRDVQLGEKQKKYEEVIALKVRMQWRRGGSWGCDRTHREALGTSSKVLFLYLHAYKLYMCGCLCMCFIL